ncbi:MAG: hypothetical protein ABIE36_03165 [Candidatus Diapherotrites archaeon]
MTLIEEEYNELEKKAEEVLKNQGISLEDLKRDTETNKKVVEGLREYNEIIYQLNEFNKMIEALKSVPNNRSYITP